MVQPVVRCLILRDVLSVKFRDNGTRLRLLFQLTDFRINRVYERLGMLSGMIVQNPTNDILKIRRRVRRPYYVYHKSRWC